MTKNLHSATLFAKLSTHALKYRPRRVVFARRLEAIEDLRTLIEIDSEHLRNTVTELIYDASHYQKGYAESFTSYKSQCEQRCKNGACAPWERGSENTDESDGEEEEESDEDTSSWEDESDEEDREEDEDSEDEVGDPNVVWQRANTASASRDGTRSDAVEDQN